jgi:hypothetical protein
MALYTESEATGLFMTGLIGGVAVAALVAAVLIASINTDWKRDAIKHGAGQFNPQSGAFEWLQK